MLKGILIAVMLLGASSAVATELMSQEQFEGLVCYSLMMTLNEVEDEIVQLKIVEAIMRVNGCMARYSAINALVDEVVDVPTEPVAPPKKKCGLIKSIFKFGKDIGLLNNSLTC